MAVNNLKDFSTQWIVGGLLMVCMVFFTISFMFSNNPNGLGTDSDSIFEDAYEESSTNLLESTEDSDTLLNITANTNPEISNLGGRDIVATSFSASGSAKQYWTSSKQLISWVFSGATGKMLLSVIGGLIGLLSYFFITKHIRTGD